ncbi:MAG: anthranilate synthase component 1 [Acidobacteria bacterium]|nr:anthranilate synthase component 1 [Acidobacteriota bacterium]
MQLTKRHIPYAPDPLSLYELVHHRHPGTFLLESADITTKQGEMSLVGVRACLDMTCRGNRVRIRSHNPLGTQIAATIHERLSAFSDGQELFFPEIDANAEEVQRLLTQSPISVLRAALNLGTEDRTLIAGTFAYDFIDTYEHLPRPEHDALAFPDYHFVLPDLFIEIHHQKQATQIYHLSSESEDYELLGALEDTCRKARDMRPRNAVLPGVQPVTCDVDDVTYQSWVSQLKQNIIAGDIFQAVPSRTYTVPCEDPLGAYARLRQSNPSPYMFVFDTPSGVLLGASPETAVKVSGNPHKVEIRPIAGTKPRGFAADGSIDRDLDTRLEAELRLDEKELAEHLMLIDLARNDIARVSKPGTRFVPKILTVDRYAHVMHLVSYVEGELRDEFDALHAYVACMNMGTLVGAPKIKAASLLRQLERTKRGPYGGAVGYLTSDGEMDTAIAIRSAFVRNGYAYVRAGAGVVFDSDPEEESLETQRKARAVIRALGGEL